jgi:hypothetical protein
MIYRWAQATILPVRFSRLRRFVVAARQSTFIVACSFGKCQRLRGTTNGPTQPH